MCLAIPGKILEVEEGERSSALVEVVGVRRRVDLGLVIDEAPKPGDWVLIHVGFALSRIDEAEAQETLALLQEMGPALEEEFAMMEQSAILRSFES